MRRRKLPGQSCPRCNGDGRCITLDYRGERTGRRPFRRFRCAVCLNDEKKPFTWTFPATDLAITVASQSAE